MRKILLILVTLLTVCVSGAWAETLNLTPSSGSYESSSGNYVKVWTSSTTPQVTITASANNMDKRQTDTYLLWHSGTAASSDYIITLPAGYLITGYTITAQGNTANQTITVGSSTTTFTTSSSSTFSLSSLVNKSAKFVLTGANASGLKITNIAIDYIEVDYTSQITSVGSLSNNKAYKIVCPRGFLTTQSDNLGSTVKNNEWSAKNFAILSYNNSYYLYSITDSKFVKSDATLTSTPQSALALSAQSGEYADTYQMTIGGSGYYVNSSSSYTYGIVINGTSALDDGNHYAILEVGDYDYTTNLEWARFIANDVLTTLSTITAYNSTASSAISTVASAATIGAIETAVNNAVAINVAFKNKLTTTAYLSTTGANISGASFSTDCAWRLQNYNPSTGTFKIYNAAHTTYIAPLPSQDYTAATATTNSASAGNYTIQTLAVEDVYYLGLTMPSVSSGHPALHYQDAGQKAVRWSWDSSTDASMWIVENVYGVTYNHYTVADPEDPSTDGASLQASSTDYYVSGTEVDYSEPLDALSPVTTLNTTPSSAAIDRDVIVNYYYLSSATLPFTTSTITNGDFDDVTWYYVTVNGFPTYAANSKMTVDNNNGPFLHDRWCFVGDAFTGVQIYCETTGATCPLNIATLASNGIPTLSASSTNSRWYVLDSSGDIQFFQKSGSTTYSLNQLGGAPYGGSYNWNVGLYDQGGTNFVLTEANNTSASTKISAAKTAIESDVLYTNSGTIGYPSSTAKSTLDAVITTANTTKTPSNYIALRSAWSTYKSTNDVTVPSTGFYRFFNSTSSCYAKPAGDGNVIEQTTTGTDKTTIFYLDGSNYLVAYNDGYVVSDCNKTGLMSDAPSAVTFEHPATGTYGTIAIKANSTSSGGNRYWYSHLTSEVNTKIDKQSDSNSNRCEWSVTTVTSLPITFRGEYASFYSPVDLEIPNNSNLKVYTGGEVNNGWMTLNEVTGTLPANTGVILHYDGWTEETTINFNILSTSATGGTGQLLGTFAAETCDASSIMVLGKSGDDWGIYEYTGTTLGGFKAYMNKLGSPVKGFAFNFADADAIVKVLNGEQQNGECYDLSGRRVSKPVKGMYIINGKKVIVK